jgi:hypothetical protein
MRDAEVRNLARLRERLRESKSATLDLAVEPSIRRATATRGHRMTSVDPDPAHGVAGSNVDGLRHEFEVSHLDIERGGFATEGEKRRSYDPKE